MKWQEIKRRSNEITRYVNPIRGKIIDGVINVESNVDVYLSVHFSKDFELQNQLTDLLFSCSSPSMPFETKRVLLMNIFKSKSKSEYEEHKFFFEELSFIIKHRNIFAHYLLNNGSTHFEEFEESKTIYFLKYKLVTEEVEYTTEFLKEIMETIKFCRNYSNGLIANIMGA